MLEIDGQKSLQEYMESVYADNIKLHKENTERKQFKDYEERNKAK